MSKAGEIYTGGPAFPWGEHGTSLGGLTKREYFAALAMQGICVNAWHNGHLFSEVPAIAKQAYEIADAMLDASSLATEDMKDV